MQQLMEQFQFTSSQQLALRFNVAPTQFVATLHADPSGSRELRLLRWGLIPAWAREKSVGSRMINARSETVAEKPSFRNAFRRRRCLVLADGYFEWKKEAGKKQPYYIRIEHGEPFAMAGLWERWSGPKDAPLDPPWETCTILTTSANLATANIHDRMPVILDRDQFDLWLDPEMQDTSVLLPLLLPYQDEAMRVDAVSTRVNSPGNDDAECVVLLN